MSKKNLSIIFYFVIVGTMIACAFWKISSTQKAELTRLEGEVTIAVQKMQERNRLFAERIGLDGDSFVGMREDYVLIIYCEKIMDRIENLEKDIKGFKALEE